MPCITFATGNDTMYKNGIDSQKVYEAATALGLGDRATREEIKERYRDLLMKWHPDVSDAAPEACKKKAAEITRAYGIIMEYCDSYRYSFSKETIVDNLPDAARMQEKWNSQYGNDPVWGTRAYRQSNCQSKK